MTRRLVVYTTVLLAVLLASTISAQAAESFVSEVGAGGYDVVAYYKEGKAVRGTGWHVANHEGTTYLFSSEANRDQFVNTPGKYLPEFGGYCAYGVAVGKKFYADPTVWKIVDGKLYLNLDKEIQKKWQSDLSDNLKKAHANWSEVKNAAPAGF
jgi:YHS domain-containing protein